MWQEELYVEPGLVGTVHIRGKLLEGLGGDKEESEYLEPGR